MQRRTQFKVLLISAPVAVLILVGGIALAASQDASAPVQPSTTPTSPATAQQSDPPTSRDADVTANEALALEAAEIMTTWNAAEDFNQTVAEERAAHLMTEERAAAITLPERPASGSEWREAADRGATSVPHAELMPYSEDQWVTVQVTWRWHSEGHNPLSGSERRFYFTFIEDGEGELLIHDYTWEDA